MGKRFTGLGLIIVSTALALLFFEGVIRIAHHFDNLRFFHLDFPGRTGGFYVYDPDLGWRNRPGYRRYHRERHATVLVEINDRGWRDKMYPLNKPAGVFRIAVLGCSFTFGEGVNMEDTFPKILEKRLNALSGQPVEVLNFGVNGYGVDQMVLNYEKYVRRYEPDLVLMQFFDFNAYRALNEVMWRTQKPRFIVDEGRLALTNHPVPRNRFSVIERKLLQSSLLYKFIKERWLVLVDIKNKRVKKDLSSNEPLHALVERLLRRLDREVRGDNAQLVVFTKGRGGQIWTGEVAQAAGVEYFNINQYEPLGPWRQKGALFNPYPDHHWSRLGHEYVTTAILNYLNDMKNGNFIEDKAGSVRAGQN